MTAQNASGNTALHICALYNQVRLCWGTRTRQHRWGTSLRQGEQNVGLQHRLIAITVPRPSKALLNCTRALSWDEAVSDCSTSLILGSSRGRWPEKSPWFNLFPIPRCFF